MISCIRLEVSTCQPRICSISGGQFPLEFEKLIFVCASRAKVANVVGGDLIERLGQHRTITRQGERWLILTPMRIDPPPSLHCSVAIGEPQANFAPGGHACGFSAVRRGISITPIPVKS
jgi:hypothetical protein